MTLLGHSVYPPTIIRTLPASSILRGRDNLPLKGASLCSCLALRVTASGCVRLSSVEPGFAFRTSRLLVSHSFASLRTKYVDAGTRDRPYLTRQAPVNHDRSLPSIHGRAPLECSTNVRLQGKQYCDQAAGRFCIRNHIQEQFGRFQVATELVSWRRQSFARQHHLDRPSRQGEPGAFWLAE